MIEASDDDQAMMSGIAQAVGFQHPIRISAELAETLKPNEYLAGLGIRFSERMKTILGILKGNLLPKNGSPEDTLPDKGIVIPLAITMGPYIREELISIRAELTDDGGREEILLTAILAQE
ncbi:MAG: hypothetical protein LBP80_01435 [Treponema sp.]|jgi:hypothetical protein|nr:hypothetical protein [Treponema sp.]